MKRGVLSYVMIVITTLIGLTNFFAPFFTAYTTDPLITYFFLTIAGTLIGVKGVAALVSSLVSLRITNDAAEKTHGKDAE